MNARAVSMLVGAALAVPADPPEVPRYIAANRIDTDANPGFTSHCDYSGIANETTDVYSCTAGYPDDFALRLEHERGTSVYRVTMLTDPVVAAGFLTAIDRTEWCTMRSEVICSTALDRRLFPRAYGNLVPGNIGCHWIDIRVHRLDPPCDSRVARDLGGPNGSWPRWP